jgi:hypothetical protein
MRWTSAVRLALVGAAALAVSACGGKSKSSPGDGAIDAASSDGSGSDAGSNDVDPSGAACLEMPGQLPRPPGDRLPCELIPPGLRP